MTALRCQTRASGVRKKKYASIYECQEGLLLHYLKYVVHIKSLVTNNRVLDAANDVSAYSRLVKRERYFLPVLS